ncbi:hypothetical protein WN944_015687 [Citrus x changshan-huyou]|uniref:Uncharacterized protein n=1 Tax=Citrus x changshan-huyou TaxID=2935761 RepID=A0AAP0M9G4_9ROSI
MARRTQPCRFSGHGQWHAALQGRLLFTFPEGIFRLKLWFLEVVRVSIYYGTIDARRAGSWACRRTGKSCPVGSGGIVDAEICSPFARPDLSTNVYVIRDAGGFTGVNPPMPKLAQGVYGKTLLSHVSVYSSCPSLSSHGSPSWDSNHRVVGFLPKLLSCHPAEVTRLGVGDDGMAELRGKLIVDESDEEIEDSYHNLSRPFDPLHHSSSPMGNRGGQASGSGENHSSEGAGIPEEVGDACATTPTDLLKLRTLYNIPKEVLLVIDGKDDVPSRPPRGILGGMHLALGQLHPNGWRVLSALYVLWERYGLEEPSLAEVKHLYQLRSSPKEAGWYYFMSSYAKRKPITGFPSSCKNWKNKFFFAGGNWCPAVHSLGGDIHLPTRFVTPESWGLINNLDDRPFLQGETALVNASTCQDLLSSTNLVGSRLVDVAVGMDTKILSAMTRKCGRVPSSSSNPSPPLKKANIGPSKASVPALPPPPPRKNGGEKASNKSPEVSIHSRDRSSPFPPWDQGDYLTPYQRNYGKSVGPKWSRILRA